MPELPSLGGVPNRRVAIAGALPLALLAILMVALSFSNVREPHESGLVLFIANLSMTTLTSAIIALLAARTFLTTGDPAQLLLSCAMTVWGSSAFVAVAGGHTGNYNITIHNCGVLLSALCHFSAGLLAARSQPFRNTEGLLAVGSVMSLVAVGLVWLGTLEQWLPVFFVEGQGGTKFRWSVLVVSSLLFGTTGFMVAATARRSSSAFYWWYALGLWSLALGCYGLAIQSVHGGWLGWTARSLQYLSSIYMMIGVFSAVRTTRAWRLPVARELERTRGEYELLFQASNDGIAVYPLASDGRPGAFVRVNEALCALTGYDSQELLTLSPIELLTSNVTGSRLSGYEFNSGMSRWFLKSRGGGVIETEVSSRHFDYHGQRTAVSVIRDITERTRFERELAERARLLDLSTDAIIIRDEQDRVLYWNEGARVLYGFRREEAIGCNSIELLQARFSQPFADIQMSMSSRGVWSGEVLHRTKEGKDVWVNSRWAQDRGAGHTFTMEINSDISERRAVEESLRLADRRKDEFLAILSHELRNPVAALANAADLLKNDLSARDAEITRSILERQLKLLRRLIDDLLDASRLSHDALTLRKTPFALNSAIDLALESCRSSIEHKSLKLDIVRSPEPLFLNGDELRIAQIVSNLLSNAVKYTSPGGRIVLRVSRTETEAVIQVEDSGIGIPPEKLEAVFELFVQVDRSVERSHGGLGIGLALVRRLTELHGGRVVAESEGEGRGSRFTVRLPVWKDVPAPAVATPVKGVESSVFGRRVLVVDDNADSSRGLQLLLEMSGALVRVAEEGLLALELGREIQPDIVLLDIGLPGLSGYEIAKAIRSEPWGKNATIVVISGWGQPEDLAKSREAGIDAHLVKPVRFHNLLQQLKNLQDRLLPGDWNPDVRDADHVGGSDLQG